MIFKHCSLSGTNDKAGGPHYMLKWASPQVGCNKSCFAKKTNLILQKWKYYFVKMQILFPKMQILFCKNANLALQKCKSCFAQMQILFCTNANIVLHKCKYCLEKNANLGNLKKILLKYFRLWSKRLCRCPASRTRTWTSNISRFNIAFNSLSFIIIVNIINYPLFSYPNYTWKRDQWESLQTIILANHTNLVSQHTQFLRWLPYYQTNQKRACMIIWVERTTINNSCWQLNMFLTITQEWFWIDWCDQASFIFSEIFASHSFTEPCSALALCVSITRNDGRYLQQCSLRKTVDNSHGKPLEHQGLKDAIKSWTLPVSFPRN